MNLVFANPLLDCLKLAGNLAIVAGTFALVLIPLLQSIWAVCEKRDRR